MATFTEVSYTSAFDVRSNGCIAVRTTTDVLKDGEVISTNYTRTMLVPNDPQASTVLNEAYYANIATYAWSQPSPQPYDPNPPTPGV
jgi:archaellum component FlaF (FlaF/FlaG flagellin family)